MRSNLLTPAAGHIIFASCMVAAAALIVASSLFAVNCHAVESRERIIQNPSASFAFSPPEAPHRHSSTYQEGVLRGMGVLQRAVAEGWVYEAQANVLNAQADAMEMDNALKRFETAVALDEMRADSWHRKRLRRIYRKEELLQAKKVEQLREALEYRLTEYDVNFTTGTVYWPAIVAGPRYAEYRREVDRLVGRMLAGGIVNSSDEEALIRVCSKFRHELHKDLFDDGRIDNSMAKAEYEVASRLLKGLRYTPVVLAEADPVNMLSMR